MPFERTPAHRIVTSTFAWTLLAAILMLAVLLVSAAGDISGMTTGTVESPLQLLAITKNPLPNGTGTSVTMSALPGIFLYGIGAVLVAGIISAVRVHTGAHRE